MKFWNVVMHGIYSTAMPIRLRPATLEDGPLLQRWDEEPEIIKSVPHADLRWQTELSDVPEWRRPIIAEEDGRPVGFIEILDPSRDADRYWGDVPPGLRAIDIWIGAAE